MIRVGIVGLAHDHVWTLLPDWERIDDVEIVAIAESSPSLRSKVELSKSKPVLFDTWERMLHDVDLDIVQITSENSAALPVVVEAARRGMAIMLEKPVAATMSDALAIFEAVEASNVTLLVNWFTYWDQAITGLLEAANGGCIGRPTYFRFRIAHAGPKEIGCNPEFYSWLYDKDRNGGGAMADFCGYGAYMSAYVLGVPQSVTAIAGRWVKDDIDLEDNGILCLQYPRAVAICEGSWSQSSLTQCEGPTIHGTEGSLSIVDGEVRLMRLGWNTYEVLSLPEPGPERRSGPSFFAHCVRNGIRPGGIFDPRLSLISQRAVVAGYASVTSQSAIPF